MLLVIDALSPISSSDRILYSSLFSVSIVFFGEVFGESKFSVKAQIYMVAILFA